ncbi:anti-sigma regulatory factor (Ser/Thr protein kinase) [Stella humosa]|uniref:Anti-sigma regulatory factor (Ser/Thr protein kinase) n=1 Tax=Stella humosa TaxID=94 RepID=A0A3N1M155_9PROT|nr:anti-sigma regulatory factor [Stella humosa]ROQ01244.1 anti-sigma regulatory factor (Ser/Thr protein kinase) [Stella humosa]BBK31618.1 TorS-related protein [Stella humosa]
MQRFLLGDPSQVAVARREAVRIAQSTGFSEDDQARLAVVVTELSVNTIRHGGGGQMLFGRGVDDDGVQLEGLWLDKGPGMADPAACLRDGFSTAGTPGNGFGAVQRMSDGFDCYSRVGQGTAVLARLRPGHAGPSAGAGQASRGWAIGAIVVPKAGELVSGDSWAVRPDGRSLCCMMVDGLGHGPQAAEAAAVAVAQFEAATDIDPAAILERIHLAMRATRGGAVAVLAIDTEVGSVRFSGVGNIAGVLLSAGMRRMVSHNGTAGGIAQRIRAFDYPRPARAVAILHSDGLSANWTIDTYPGLASCDPTLIAGVLFRDQERGRDDAAVLVVKELAA